MVKKKQSEPYIATYLHAKGRRLGLPIGGNFELTARCNFNCPMCYVHMSPEQVAATGKELTAQQWLSIAAAAQKKGLVFALLTGGEPFVRKDFFEIYKGMKELGLLISINSNGSMLRGDIRRKILEDPPFRFNISLYGGCNETYKRMCGVPMYDTVVENIRALKEAGVDVSLNLSITPDNYKDLQKIYDTAVALDVNVRASSYMYPPVRINGQQYGCSNRLSAEESARCSVVWDSLRFTPEEFNIRAQNMASMTNIPEEGCFGEVDEGIRCRAGSTSFWITWDGKMMPCGMMTTPVAYPVQQGFDAAWETIKEQTKAIRMPVECATCNKKELCGVCAAVCFTETGQFNKVPTYICEKTQKQIEITQEIYKERHGL